MTGETSERVVRKILEVRAIASDLNTIDLAKLVSISLGETVTEANVVRVLDEARAEKMRGRE